MPAKVQIALQSDHPVDSFRTLPLFSVLLLVLLFSVQSTLARGYGMFVAPKETDGSISRSLGDHYVVMNPWVIQRNVLFLFFPGTASKAVNYKTICETASNQGFYVVSLQYPNDISVNFTCEKGRNIDCYENMRREILFGSDFSPLVNVNRANCIENRLVKLLRYLSVQLPLDGWDQFLTSGGTPRWSKILVAGHSQGGGHAGLLGKYYTTAGVIMFSSMDYNSNLNKAATWVTQSGRTKPNKFFAVTHSLDKTMPLWMMRKYWNAWGFRRMGPVVNIDQNGFPYQNSRTLISSIIPSRLDKMKSNYHNAMVMDADTPISANGRALLSDLWIYLLNAPFSQ